MSFYVWVFSSLPRRCVDGGLQEAIRKEGDEEQEEVAGAALAAANSPVKRAIGSPFAR